jgi:SAM-dependent methyltransferase
VPDYNERLFAKRGLRSYYHLSRFRWLHERLVAQKDAQLRVVELGCFDGRVLQHTPGKVERYVGLDANWEGGLDLGRAAYAGRPEVSLIECTCAETLHQFANRSFNTAVSLETLEHIPEPAMREYLAEIARVTDGHFYVSVPNEMGAVFLVKYLMKRAVYGDSENYTLKEIVAATARQSHKVRRKEHKGFDYRRLIDELAVHFDIVRVEGLASFGLPPALSLSVGIVARTRH